MRIKWVFLLLLLVLPAAVYMFLQGFGDNRFGIPIYYEEGVEAAAADCQFSEGAHLAPEYKQFDAGFTESEDGVVVYDFGSARCDSCRFKTNNLMSLSNTFSGWSDFKLLSIINSTHRGAYPDSSGSRWMLHLSTSDSWKSFANCGLNLALNQVHHDTLVSNGKVVLVDQKRRIRGYYNLFDRKEADRLSVELEILRKNIRRGID